MTERDMGSKGVRHRKLRLALQVSAAVLWALSAVAQWHSGETGRTMYLTAMAAGATITAIGLARGSTDDSRRG